MGRNSFFVFIPSISLSIFWASCGPLDITNKNSNSIPNPAGTHSFLRQFGDCVAGGPCLMNPSYLALDGKGNLYITAQQNDCIEVWTTSGTYEYYLGGSSQFTSGPGGVALDGLGDTYASDFSGNRIVALTGSAAPVIGSYGSGNGQLSEPLALAADSGGNVYVADVGNNRIEVFSPAGAYVTQWGSWGTGNGQFRGLGGIVLDGNGHLYVADAGNSRIQEFTTSGSPVTQWGGQGTGNGQFSTNSPAGLAFGANGFLYAVDSGNNRIEEFNSSGTFQTAWGSAGSGQGQFENPSGIAVDASLNVYVSNMAYIEVFGP